MENDHHKNFMKLKSLKETEKHISLIGKQSDLSFSL